MTRHIQPADNYDALLVQFRALISLRDSMEKTLIHYREKDYSLSQPVLEKLEEDLESEREMNHLLTQELAEVRGWQPIDTAPKNGSNFLVYLPKAKKRSFAAAYYQDGRYLHDRAGNSIVASHWMPLPACPKDTD